MCIDANVTDSMIVMHPSSPNLKESVASWHKLQPSNCACKVDMDHIVMYWYVSVS